MKALTLSIVASLSLLALIGCGSTEVGSDMSPELRAQYAKAAEEQRATDKLPPEQQIEKVRNNPNMPEMYKPAVIAKIKAKYGLK